jgi:hypothetical protein
LFTYKKRKKKVRTSIQTFDIEESIDRTLNSKSRELAKKKEGQTQSVLQCFDNVTLMLKSILVRKDNEQAPSSPKVSKIINK